MIIELGDLLMIIELGDNGLRDRYHWSSHEVDDQAIDHYLTEARVRFRSKYLAVRSRCPFLTDDNHEWEARDYGPAQFHHAKLRELQDSSRYSITIREKSPVTTPRYWFHFTYRVPGQLICLHYGI